MGDAASCAECEAILDDFHSAAGMATREQVSAARETLRTLLTADDEGLEEFIEKRRFRPQLDRSIKFQPDSPRRIELVLRRAWAHRADTGHWPLPFR